MKFVKLGVGLCRRRLQPANSKLVFSLTDRDWLQNYDLFIQTKNAAKELKVSKYPS